MDYAKNNLEANGNKKNQKESRYIADNKFWIKNSFKVLWLVLVMHSIYQVVIVIRTKAG